ncbi:hypothetical protein TRFO_17321 [Tritrichomonas foetus]|uniref:Uncharacterized protein n=1 Tax=Tritrichomonas foetus TaxID=1144522 RepID=A0A1J4KNT1_9EUKA|nr:hypothetical protein TRFO_17321 [Tritrichomonas foetus]|eukprot:OHT12770.1 hypothetical protein TRFO_17321 [Tritrichomonas foetus]
MSLKQSCVNSSFKALPYYLTQCFWIIYFVAPIIIAYLFPNKTSIVRIVSRSIFHASNILNLNNENIKNAENANTRSKISNKKILNTIWNTSNDPFIFAHISDTHFSSLKTENNDVFNIALDLLNRWNPKFTVNSGDLVDNLDSMKMPVFGQQDEDSWKIYHKVFENYSNPLFECAGNHDMFGVKGRTSEGNYFTHYSHSLQGRRFQSDDDFKLQVFEFINNNSNNINNYNILNDNKFHVIAINPFEFPTAHSLMLLFASIDKEILDRLEDALDQYPNSIVMSHYPVLEFHSEKSKKGRTFQDIIGSEDVMIYLSGHSHPIDCTLQHHGKGNLEVIAPSTRNEYRQFGMVSIDNGNIRWSVVNMNNPSDFIVTYPIPKEQLTFHSTFDDLTSEIRVVSLSKNTEAKIHVQVLKKSPESSLSSKLLNSITSTKLFKFYRILKAKVLSKPVKTLEMEEILKSYAIVKEDNLKFDREFDGHALYSTPLGITEYGEYKIYFTGDFEYEFDTVFNTSVEVGGENEPEHVSVMWMLSYIFIVVWIFLAVIVTPLPFTCTFFEKVEDWIEGINTESSYWLFSIFLGFFACRARVQRAPTLVRLIALFAVYSVFFLPSLIFETEGTLGFTWIYGIFINNVSYYADYGTFYGLFYLMIVCFPMLILISSFGVKEWNLWLLGDLIFALIPIAGIPFICIRVAIQTSGRFYIIFSPQFVILPILIIIMFIVWRILANRKPKSIMSETSLENPLTTQIDTSVYK